MMRPRAAILVLNWNGWKDTIECLDSVFRLEYDNFVVVLCDNASTDGSIERIRAWRADPSAKANAMVSQHVQSKGRSLPASIPIVELTRAQAEAGEGDAGDAPLVLIHNGGNLGFAQGNNVGLRYVLSRPEFEYVWILNNDVAVDSKSLAELVTCAVAHPDVAGVGGTVYEYNEPDAVQAAGGGVFSMTHATPRLIQKPRRRLTAAKDAPPVVDFITGACMLVRTDELRRAGLIDESFFIYAEDVDLSVRLRANGSSLVHAERAKIWHKGGGAVGHRSRNHDYYTIRNTLAVVRKHYPMMTPVVATYLIYRAVLPKIVRRQWARLSAAWRGYRDYRSRVTGPSPL